MAGMNDFTKEKWTVKTAVPRALTGHLPAKGCTISFKQGDPKTCCMVASSSNPEARFEGFKLKNGRLEREIPGSANKVVVLEHAKPAKGTKGAKARLKGYLKVGDKAMSGTWGAESGGGGGGGGGGNVYPTDAPADAG